MRAILEEIARKFGCPSERFERCFRQRQQYWHQKLLEKYEQEDPALTVRLDRRRDDADVSMGSFEPLFPDESDQGG